MKVVGPLAASEFSEGRDDSSAISEMSLERKLNLKLLSLWAQRGLSALAVREEELLDLGLISVRREKEGRRRMH